MGLAVFYHIVVGGKSYLTVFKYLNPMDEIKYFIKIFADWSSRSPIMYQVHWIHLAAMYAFCTLPLMSLETALLQEITRETSTSLIFTGTGVCVCLCAFVHVCVHTFIC